MKIGGQIIPGRTVLLVISECCVIAAGLLLAIALRFAQTGSLGDILRDSSVLMRFGLVVVVCELALYYTDLYDPQQVRGRMAVVISLVQALGISCLVLGVLYFIGPDLTLGRGIAGLAVPSVFVTIFVWRILVDVAAAKLGRPERVLVLGTGETGINLVRELCWRPELNLKVIGFLDENGENIGKPLVNPGIIGDAANVEQIVASENVDRVVVSLAERRGRMPVQQLLHIRFAGTIVEDAHTLFERVTGRIMLESLTPSWLFFSDGFRKSRWLLAAKRLIDILSSTVLLTVSAPVIGLVALAVRLESPGPVLFRQVRVGLNGKQFQMLKFRSMYDNDGSDKPSWTKAGDRRITRVGAIIRKCRFDELPQLINVLRGDMSLVGPRPEVPYFCEMLEQQIPFFPQRHSVRPGVTGWAQIKYQYGASVEDAKRKLELDLFYIKHLSVALDLAIIFGTAKVMLLGRGAK